MKVGILTLYYNNANYGGLLQSYALNNVLNSMGYESEQISYDFKMESFSGFSKIKYVVKKSVKQFIPGFMHHNSKFEKTLKAFEHSIPHSRRVTKNNIKRLNYKYNVFICGSDQIWNPIGWQETFFLNFATKPKISYAASVARDFLSKEEIAFISNLTSDFSSLSVREQNMSNFLSNKLDRKFEQVPDPTLLLSKEEWNEKFPNKVKTNSDRPYIFAYFLGFNTKQRNDCIDFAKSKGFDIYFIPFMKNDSYTWDKKHSKYFTKQFKVEDFLDLIRNAELILTDSFHGAVFSCIFEKPFYVLNRKLVGNEKSMNSRLSTLFEQLRIEDSRMIDDVFLIDRYNFTEKELRRIKESKDSCKVKGNDYLRKAIEKVKNE
ncbi:polysaccharide pyruvyl transferase family protein [Streptococcus equinus]|uniref:polysaccharide pyruvyl transferase family protein n=1 Tax=Streptococcus equinus TaxID=1335 RepID=UPI0005F7E529|nr:polysaccharide pyruvyl transferase family protein [Streptococcus equinus]